MDPSARLVNHSGCSFTHGWSGEACSARSRATSMPSSRVRPTKASKSSIVPRSGCSASCPPSGDPIAHGEPGSPSTGVSVLFLPFLNVVPMGCTGGRYTTSKPMAAIASSRLAAVRSVPETGARRPIGSIWTPSERGKNSYHEPYRARSRSTWTVSGLDLVTSSRSGQVARMAVIWGSSDAASRSHGVSPRSRSRATSARSAVRAAAGRLAPGGWGIRRAARSNSSAPSVSISSTS